jgi:hypothetical protein
LVSRVKADFDGAVDELVEALRDSADLRVDDLRRYPDHEERRGLVDLILLSDGDELREHIFGEE